MIDTMNEVLSVVDKRNEQLSGVLESLYAAARPGAVFSEPVVAGNYTVITACEVATGGGFGSGLGFGPTVKSEAQQAQERMSQAQQLGGGGGLSGGGGSIGRPIAVISIGPEGVTVKPVVDATKIALASFTTIGALFVLLGKLLRAGRSISR